MAKRKRKTASVKQSNPKVSGSVKIKIPARTSHPVVNIESSPQQPSDVPEEYLAFSPKTAHHFAEFDRLMNEDIDYQLPRPSAFQTPSAKRNSTISDPKSPSLSPLPPGPNFHKRMRLASGNSSLEMPNDDEDGFTSSSEAFASTSASRVGSRVGFRPSQNSDTKRGRGRPRKDRDAFCIKLYVEVLGEMRMEPGKTKRSAPRVITDNSQRFGPRNLTNKDTYHDFLTACASMVHCRPENLVTSSMSWSFIKDSKVASKTPKAGGGLPIADEDGFMSMTDDIKNLSDDKKAVCKVMVTMGRPLSPSNPLPSWATDSVAPVPVEEPMSMTMAPLIGNFRNIDEKLRPIVEKLKEKYPIGNCRQHQDIHCYQYETRGWHFELDNNRCKVWAQAIWRNETDENTPPIGSVFFKQNQAIRDGTSAGRVHASRAVSVHTENPTSVPSPVPSSPAFISPFVTGYPPSYPVFPTAVPAPYPLYYPAPYPQAGGGVHVQPPSTPVRSSDVRSSSPPIPSPERAKNPIDVHKWCEEAGFGDSGISAFLENVGFCIGDKLKYIKDEDWKHAGIKTVHWRRFADKYRKWSREQHK